MLDRDETGLQLAQLGTAGHGLLDTKDVVLCDIREEEPLHAIFAERRPEVVFHAAALKHLPMLEQFPDEAWKTNVLGTLNVINAGRAVGVDTFINISTDKAANPTSVWDTRSVSPRSSRRGRPKIPGIVTCRCASAMSSAVAGRCCRRFRRSFRRAVRSR